MKVIARYGHVRAPYSTRRLITTSSDWIIEQRQTVPLSERQWRSLIEASFRP